MEFIGIREAAGVDAQERAGVDFNMVTQILNYLNVDAVPMEMYWTEVSNPERHHPVKRVFGNAHAIVQV